MRPAQQEKGRKPRTMTLIEISQIFFNYKLYNFIQSTLQKMQMNAYDREQTSVAREVG